MPRPARRPGLSARRFNAVTRAFYEHGALGLPNRKGYPLSLRNYQLFISYAEAPRCPDEEAFRSLSQTLSIVRHSLSAACLASMLVDDAGLLALMRELVN